MANAFDHLSKAPVVGPNGIVRRPLSSDAIGAALEAAFAPRQSVPADLAVAIAKLDMLG